MSTLREKVKEKIKERVLKRGQRIFDKGGMSAFGKYSGRVGGRAKKREERKTVRSERRTARKEKVTARRAKVTSMKEKSRTSSYLKQDIDFFRINARQRGMKLPDYYAKYVK